MPVKVWQSDDSGLHSRVVTGWDTLWTAEEYREDAENLDQQLDNLLDEALVKMRRNKPPSAPPAFVRAWGVGRSLIESEVFEAPALKREKRELLWRALASKCRTGAKHNGETNKRWHGLRPRTVGEPRREGGRLDYFEMCWWLAEQEFNDAVCTFGGSVRNAWQMLERPTLKPLVLRKALRAWANSQADGGEQLLGPQTFPRLMKALRQRWPDRGPGSAKRPIHYRLDELQKELSKVLEPLRAELT